MSRLILLLLLLCCPLSAWGAIAEVGAGSQRAGATAGNFDSLALAFPANVVSGNLLIAGGALYHTGGGPASVTVTSTCSSAFSVLLSTAAGDYKSFIAYALATSSAACTVTVDPVDATGNYGSYGIDEFSGVAATPLDVDGGSSTGTGTAVTDSLTTATANALVIGAMTHTGGSETLTPGGSYTQINENHSATNAPHNTVFRLVTTATAYTVDWTVGASVTWKASTAAFAEAVAGGAVLPGGTRPMTHF